MRDVPSPAAILTRRRTCGIRDAPDQGGPRSREQMIGDAVIEELRKLDEGSVHPLRYRLPWG